MATDEHSFVLIANFFAIISDFFSRKWTGTYAKNASNNTAATVNCAKKIRGIKKINPATKLTPHSILSSSIGPQLRPNKQNTGFQRAGEGRRRWATTISPSVPHISFFLFRQPWATTISPSVPPHLTLPGKTTFLNGIFRAFKVWFLKIQPRRAKKHNSNHFFNST